MNIWNNRRLDDFERAAEGGDVLRGLPPTRLPFEIAVFSHADTAKDVWTLTFLCEDLAPRPQSASEVTATVKVRATCALGAARLEALGFNAERLDKLADPGWRTLEQTWRFEARTTVEGLEAVAKGAVARIRAHIDRALAREQAKREALQSRLRSRSFSSFGDGGD